MTSTEFRANSTLVSGLRELLSSETFLIAISILENEGPLKQRAKDADANRVLGRIEGFDEYATRLKRLALYTSQTNIDNDAVTPTEEEENA